MSASWPPDFKKYENLSNEQVVKAITSESQNKLAPSNYTHFFSQIANIINSQEETIKKQKTLNDNNAHGFKTVETNFHSLRSLYEEEHERCLDLEQRNIDDIIKHEAAIQQLQVQWEEKLNSEKQEHKKTVEKQALVRRRMEQELVQNMKEAEELKQRLRDAETKAANLERAIANSKSQYQLLQSPYQDRGAAAAGPSSNNANMDIMAYLNINSQ